MTKFRSIWHYSVAPKSSDTFGKIFKPFNPGGYYDSKNVAVSRNVDVMKLHRVTKIWFRKSSKSYS